MCSSEKKEKDWPIKYALNTHMWCAIIVNKQMKNHHRALTVQPENLKIKLLKNFHRNFNFFSSSLSLTRFRSIPQQIFIFVRLHLRKISLQEEFAFYHVRLPARDCICAQREIPTLHTLFNDISDDHFMISGDNAENKNSLERFSREKN